MPLASAFSEKFSRRRPERRSWPPLTDLASGRLLLDQTNLTSVVNEAKRLSAAHTAVAGHRSFDILHVAAASHHSAKVFLSFDANQRSLAQAAGLKTMP